MLRIIRKHWQWSLAFAAAVVVSVGAFVFLTKPTYEPVARIEVESGHETFSLQPVETQSDSTQYAETQAKNLESRELALTVIRKLHLDHNTEWLGVPPKSNGKMATSPQQPGSNSPETTSSEYRALEHFSSSLKVKRDSVSWLIAVSFAAHDPRLAALVTNTLVESFIESDYQTRNDVISKSTEWLSRELDDIRVRMNESNRALAEFQRSSGIVAAGNSLNSFDERMSELNRQLTLAQAERIQLEALRDRAAGNRPDALAQVSADPAVQQLSEKLDTARAELKLSLVLLGRNNPKIKELQAEVDELQAELKSQQNRVVTNINTSFAAANTREHLLNQELKKATSQVGQVAQYETLKKTAQANEDLYNSLYAKVKEAAISAEARTSNIRWVEHAPILNKPTSPKRGLDMAAALVGGLLGGILLAFLRESLDTRVHTIDDVRDWTGLPSVSLIPLMEATERKALVKPGWLSQRRPFLLQRPNSREAEALRGLFTSVTLSFPEDEAHVLLIASAAPSEGKTTIAVNLAVALARTKKTCIVDADLRKPGLAAIFGIERQHGLAEVLCDYSSVEDALTPVPGLPNLTMLPVGVVPGEASELLTASRMRSVLLSLRQQFEYVVVDSPPIIPYADARAISSLVDGVILVGRSGVTTRESIKRSLELLQEVHSAPVLEVVLNGVPRTSPDYSYHYGYTATA